MGVRGTGVAVQKQAGDRVRLRGCPSLVCFGIGQIGWRKTRYLAYVFVVGLESEEEVERFEGACILV